jgi:hypothetical protein
MPPLFAAFRFSHISDRVLIRSTAMGYIRKGFEITSFVLKQMAKTG